MSGTVYQTVALVKEIEVCPDKCAIKFHPVKKHSIDQHFLCLEIKKPQTDQCFSDMEKEAISIKDTYKLFEKLIIPLDNKQKEFELLKTAAVNALPVQIQFKKESDGYELCKVRVEF